MMTLVGVVAVALAGACTAPQPPPPEPSVLPVDSSPSSSAVTTGSGVEPRGEVPLSLPPVEEPTPQGGPWDQVEVSVSDVDQANAESGLPESFVDYMVARLTVEDEAGCTTTAFEISAQHRDGFVFGAEESPCHNGFAVWGIDEGEWRYLTLFEDPPQCAELAELGVPVDVPGLSCEDEDFQVRSY